jgi:hypothetical protein
MRAELVQTGARVLESLGEGPAARQSAGGGPPIARSSEDHPLPSERDLERPSGPVDLLRTEKGAKLDATRRASLITPIAWFHVPKAGTSIINTLYHTPTICPGFSFANFVDTSNGTAGWDPSWGLRGEVCRGGFSETYGGTVTPGYAHTGIGGLTGAPYKLNRGHFVGMFRQPEQRLISDYYYYGAIPLLDDNGHEVWPYSADYAQRGSTSVSLREYAEWSGGCTVRQLTRDLLEPYKSLPLPKTEDVSVAIKALQEGFAFVGITEEWTLSVCLFHAMFGGPCLNSDLQNTRPGSEANSSDYDTSELYGWVDVWDRPVYAEAVSLFESARNLYGVDSQWCASSCHD